MLYTQLLAFPILAASGITLGVWLSKRRGWWVAVIAAFIVIGIVILGERTEPLRFIPPMCWFVNLNWNPLLMTPAISVLLTVLLMQLPQRRTRYFVATAMAVMLLVYGLFPAVMPLAARGNLLSAVTVVDSDGVCRQRHGFSCGPASAVTCLGQLGYRQDEGRLAVAAHCGPGVGTDGWALAAAMEQVVPAFQFRYQYVATLDDLRTPAVADMSIPGIGGHYVAVLAVGPQDVLVGDPMGGLDHVPRDVFLSEWKHGAIMVEKIGEPQ